MSSDMGRSIESVGAAVEALHEDLRLFRDHNAAEFERVDVRLHALTVEQARARGDIESLKENSATRGELRAGVDLIMNRLDGLAGKMDDMRYYMAKQNDRLDGHETRITRLESGRS